MTQRLLVIITMLSLVLINTGCGSQDIPPAHRGRMFDKTGVLALYSGGSGLTGPILNAGTTYTGYYNEVRTIDCTTRTFKEPMRSMTKDNVQFDLDVYITCGANCEKDQAVEILLNKLAPTGKLDAQQSAPGAGNATPDERDPVETDPDKAVTSRQVYNTFIRPALGEAVRQAVAGYDANDLNSHREELFGRIKQKLDKDLLPDDKDKGAAPALVAISGFNLSNFKLPDEMAQAAADQATQRVLRDKSVAEQEKIKVETDTAKLQVAKAEADAQAEAAKIRVVGKALHENPEYYVRDVYYYAAEKGGSVVLPADPKVILNMTPGRH